MYFGLLKLLTVDKDLALTGAIQFILRAISCQLKIISLFNHEGFTTERVKHMIGKMKKKHRIEEKK